MEHGLIYGGYGLIWLQNVGLTHFIYLNLFNLYFIYSLPLVKEVQRLVSKFAADFTVLFCNRRHQVFSKKAKFRIQSDLLLPQL